MAYYAALTSLRELLEDIIHHDRYPSFRRGRENIMTSLYGKFVALEELLQDYTSEGEEAADRLEGLIRDAACNTQDIIELEIFEQIRPLRKAINKAVRWLTRKDQLHKNLEMVEHEIDSITGELATIMERQRFKNLQLKTDASTHHVFEQTPDETNTMVGFDEYLTTIKDQLCGQSLRLQVIPISGTGGIGKTTLARNVFHDALVMYYFDYRGWTTVSQHYNENKVLQSLLKSLMSKTDKSNGEEAEASKERIYQYLKGMRYLVVIDDIWSIEVWDDLRSIFPDDCNGSRIVLTTRSLDIAQYTSSCGIVHQIQFLNKEDSWSLFQGKVFVQDHCPPEFESIGKSIASKCYGLPLAIVVIAGILSKAALILNDWKQLARNMSTVLSSKDSHFSKILYLSYAHLPHHLKACFLYIGSHPEDHNIRISRLIEMWIHLGFLRPHRDLQSLKEVGEECIEDLVRRNLVVITKKRSDGRFTSCVLHDLLRDICKDIASRQNLSFIIERGVVFLNQERYASQQHFNFHGYPHFRQYYPFVSSYLYRPVPEWSENRMFSEFKKENRDRYKLVKVMAVHFRTTSSIPEAILRMFHLKYLHLHVFRFEARMFWKMTQLRHLLVSEMNLPPAPGVGSNAVVKLEYLQTLMTVYDFTFTDEAIERIPNLRKLKTWYRGAEGTCKWRLHGLNKLIHLEHLENLEVSFKKECSSYHPPVESFPGSFAFPPSLRKLSMTGCLLPWKDLSVVGALPNLQVLKLRKGSYLGEEWKPIEGEFRSLKFILMEWLDLKYWRAETDCFPCLEHLVIKSCRLVQIPLEIGNILTLKTILVDGNNATAESAIRILEEQRDMGNDVLQVSVGHLKYGDIPPHQKPAFVG
ncbi:late blight resistance protein R1-A-like isoform X2 [Andrographis paniculata]|uniref:late blight resistance protein R1-A-like isoform X2 n=1 Tax=Andrographis paniculata TaxID=175694 RepID=UPI0021E7B855|nr:late blight resistance protein R1-A-like isoform X2 [Andrographis paniculata]